MIDNLHIAIDGPAASGKTASAKRLSKELAIPYIDTGIMYRGLSYYLLTEIKDIYGKNVIENFDFDNNVSILVDEDQKLFINDHDITQYLYTEEITKLVSFFASIEAVRIYLVKEQRIMAKNKNLIMVGRDIGTVVLPNAKYKFFLDCNLQTRANRRIDQEKKQYGDTVDIDKKLDQIKKRDLIDKSRELSPLKSAKDAIIIYNDHIDLAETVQLMKNIVVE